MIGNRRGILIGFALVVVLSILAAVGYGVIGLVVPSLPPPERADREQLARWLVVKDLAAESAETRLVLVRRLEAEFLDSGSLSKVMAELDSQQRQRLWDNLVLLLEPWLLDKADQFARLKGDRRIGYLDKCLDRMERLREAGAVGEGLAAGESGEGTPPDLVATLRGQVDEIAQRAEPQVGQCVRDFWAAVEARWLMRKVRDWGLGIRD